MFVTLSNNSSNTFIKNLGADGHGVAVSQVSPYPFYRSMPITKEFHDVIKGRTGRDAFLCLDGGLHRRQGHGRRACAAPARSRRARS